ncbi:MAG: hypothetical protein K9W42_13290 [Candidatus Heimdallarchaeota archaeon]|nr:hypothetical protein [Candidatus Heimdallarchaeota archaeon]
MMHTLAFKKYSLPNFDEFRTNLQEFLTKLDRQIKLLKEEDAAGDNYGKIILYLYQGLFSVVDAERKYRAGDYVGAEADYVEGTKLIGRFQRMNTNFPLEFQQEAERLDLFANGRKSECQALKKERSIDEQIAFLLEAVNSYTLEAAIVEKRKIPLGVYNAKARINFVQGLIKRLEGQKAFGMKDLYLAKKRHLEAYRHFVLATYFNPTYSPWITEQNKTIKQVMNVIIREKAAKIWGEAFALSSEGQFLMCSEKCSLASKFYRKASKIATEKKDSMLMNAYSLMLRASMYEAKANDFLKNKNDAKGAIPQFEFAMKAMTEAVVALPQMEDKESLRMRWEAQLQYYKGYFYQTQGIHNLDNEKYKEALEFFKQASAEFKKGMKNAEVVKDNNLIQLLNKSLAESKGYMGMCKTVLD